MTIPRLYVPLIEPEDVGRHLGKEEEHWKEGRSAHALAVTWSKANGLPKSIAAALASKPEFKDAELIDAFLERQVELGTAGRPSQTDILALAGLRDKVAVLAVEGKAGESFDKRVSAWFDGSASRRARLADLCKRLGLAEGDVQPLRYQLIHRAASALLEAHRYRTDVAILLVHSFSDDKEGFQDFAAFLRAMKFDEVTSGKLVGPVRCDGVLLYAGWVQDDAPKSSRPDGYLRDLDGYASRLSHWCDRVRAFCSKTPPKP